MTLPTKINLSIKRKEIVVIQERKIYMDELIKLVAKKVGIPEAQAKMAVETVIGFLKQKLPAPIAAQIDTVLGGGMPDVSALGGLFGKKK
jgi:hypothetical protein